MSNSYPCSTAQRVRRFPALLSLILALAFAAAAGAQEPSSTTSLQTTAYVYLVRADQARDEGKAKDAVRFYSESLKAYRQVAETHPDWNRKIVQFRIKYCKDQIAAISKDAPKEVPPGVVESAGKDRTKARNDALTRENEYLRSRIKDLQRKGSPEPGGFEGELKVLQSENKKLTEQLMQASKKSAPPVIKPATPTASTEKTRKLVRENQSMRNKLFDSEQMVSRLKKALEAKGDRSALEQQLQKLKADNAKLQQRLQLAFKDTERIVQSNEDLQQALREENERLKQEHAGLASERERLGKRVQILERAAEDATEVSADRAKVALVNNRLKMEVEELKARLRGGDALNREISRLKTDYSKLLSERNELKLDLSKLESQAKRSEASGMQLAKLQEKNNTLIKDVESLREVVETRTAKMEANGQDLMEAKARVAGLERKNQELESDLARAQLNSEQTKAILDERERLREETEALRKDLNSAQGEKRQFLDAITEVRSQIQTKNEEIVGLRAKTREAKGESEQLMGYVTQLQDLVNQLSAAKDQKDRLQKEKEQAARRIDNKRLAELRKENETLRQRLEKALSSMQETLKEKRNRVGMEEEITRMELSLNKSQSEVRKLTQEIDILHQTIRFVEKTKGTGSRSKKNVPAATAIREQEIRELRVSLTTALTQLKSARAEIKQLNGKIVDLETRPIEPLIQFATSKKPSQIKKPEATPAEPRTPRIKSPRKEGENPGSGLFSIFRSPKSEKPLAPVVSEAPTQPKKAEPVEVARKPLTFDDLDKPLTWGPPPERTTARKTSPIRNPFRIKKEPRQEPEKEPVGSTPSIRVERKPPVRPPVKTPKPAASPEQVASTIQQGGRLESQQRFTEALMIYNMALQQGVRHGDIYTAKGRCLLHLGQGELAIGALEEGKAMDPQNKSLVLFLGIALYSSANYAESAAVLQELTEADPGNARAFNALGAAKMELNELDDALALFLKTIELDPNLADAHYNMAQAYISIQPPNLEKARTHYNRSVNLGASQDRELETILGVP